MSSRVVFLVKILLALSVSSRTSMLNSCVIFVSVTQLGNNLISIRQFVELQENNDTCKVALNWKTSDKIEKLD